MFGHEIICKSVRRDNIETRRGVELGSVLASKGKERVCPKCQAEGDAARSVRTVRKYKIEGTKNKVDNMDLDLGAIRSLSTCARLPESPARGSTISTTFASVPAFAPGNRRCNPMCAAEMTTAAPPLQKTSQSVLTCYAATKQRSPTGSAHARWCRYVCPRPSAVEDRQSE